MALPAMTLRRRLIIAVTALLVVLLVAGVTVLGLQRSYLMARLDSELRTLATSPRALLLAAQRDDGSTNAAAPVSTVYLGRLIPDGRLITISAPVNDPALVPDLPAGQRLDTPTTQRTRSGQASRVRLITTALPSGRGVAVLALPLAGVDAVTRRLAFTLLLAGCAVLVVLILLVSWVDRLSLRPIGAMTRTAQAIAAGDRTRRVPTGPAGSETDQLGQALNAMLDSTTAAHEQLRRFVADASHELRTPLTTLQGYAALHAARPPGPLDDSGRAEVDDAMRRMGAESARLRRLVDGLLDLATLEQPAQLRPARIDLTALLADIAADLRVVAPDRMITLDTPASRIIEADPDRLTQAIVGLTANAVRHTPPGTPVTIAVADEGADHIRIDVRDTGPGIPAADLPHVLERFYRVDRSRSAGSGGSGLGLAIIEAIARAHGGFVTIESRPGEGTRASLHLPTRVLSGNDAGWPADRAAGAGRLSGGRTAFIRDFRHHDQ